MQPASSLSPVGDLDPAHSIDLHRLARGIAPRAVDLDDVAQEARIAAWQAGHRARVPRSWLAGVVRNRVISRWRADERRVRREQAVQEPSSVRTPEERVQLTEQLRRLATALDGLDPVDRRLVIGRYYEERTAPELAEQLGLRPSTVRTRLSRAVGRLRRELGVEAEPLFARISAALLLRLPASPTKTASIAMTQATLKAGLVAATVVLFAAAAWKTNPPDDSMSDPSPVVGASMASPAKAEESSRTPVPSTTDEAEPSRRRASAASGSVAMPTAAPEPEPEPEPGQMLAERGLPVPPYPAAAAYVELILETNRQIAEESEIFDDCLSAQGQRDTGRIVLDARLVGEADVALMFDEVSVTEDDIGDASMLECLEQSLLAVELQIPGQAYYQHYAYAFDFATGQMNIHAKPTAKQREQIESVYPDIEQGPYASLVDEEPDEVALGLLPSKRQRPNEHE